MMEQTCVSKPFFLDDPPSRHAFNLLLLLLIPSHSRNRNYCVVTSVLPFVVGKVPKVRSYGRRAIMCGEVFFVGPRGLSTCHLLQIYY